MRGMTLARMAQACKGKLIGTDSLQEAKGVVIDSRLVKEGYVFIAVPGEKVDGHSFISKVLEQGAIGVICEKEPECSMVNLAGNPIPYILVENSLQALKDIAADYRKSLQIPIVGITGSVGKTSTKEFVAAVLETKFKVLKTQGNFNNEIGVPLTILRINEEHEAAVLEMGINHFGEMHRLSEMARPNICLFTNIGQCHLEFLGSRDGILKAKTEMFDFMAEDGSVCVNGDDDKLITIDTVKGKKPVTFGLSDAFDIYATDCVNNGLYGSDMELHMNDKSYPVHIPLPGDHMIYNALAAASIGQLLGLSEAQIVEGIGKVQAVAGRSNVIHLEDKILIDDCYNANPVSMEAAIMLLNTAKSRKVAILGDMFELGDGEVEMHAGIGRFAASQAIDLLICVGKLSEHMYLAAKEAGGNAVYFQTVEAMQNGLQSLLQKNDTILLKASHGMGFANLIDPLKELRL